MKKVNKYFCHMQLNEDTNTLNERMDSTLLWEYYQQIHFLLSRDLQNKKMTVFVIFATTLFHQRNVMSFVLGVPYSSNTLETFNTISQS